VLIRDIHLVASEVNAGQAPLRKPCPRSFSRYSYRVNAAR
jgi:hypothetical protein